jgi:type IV pilus assembly protein PilO
MSIIDELNGLDINDIGSWTRRVKFLMAGILCVVILGGGFYWIIQDQQAVLATEERKEPGLKDSYLQKKALAINLDAYKQQMIEAEETFGVLLKQLPNESEIPDLLIDMTQVGLSRGLQFEQIKPGGNVDKDFYAEKNVNIVANGTYHQIAGFVSDVAALPRIINVSDFSVQRLEDTSENLKFRATTKTYHYLEESYVSQ